MPSFISSYFAINEKDFAKYKQAFPHINLTAEFINIEDYCRRHPARVKRMKSWPRFLTNCLRRVRKPLNPYEPDNAKFKRQQAEWDAEEKAHPAELTKIIDGLNKKTDINKVL